VWIESLKVLIDVEVDEGIQWQRHATFAVGQVPMRLNYRAEPAPNRAQSFQQAELI
jgi:hypothetical protein